MIIDLLRAGACPQEFPPAPLLASHVAVFEVNAVAAYLERVHPQETFEVDFARDMPNVAPLGQVCCFEWSYPWPNPLGVNPPAQRLAVLATTLVDLADQHWVDVAPQFAARARERGARWIVGLSVLVLTPQSQVGYFPAIGSLYVAQNGQACHYSLLVPPGEESDPAEAEMAVKSISTVPLTAICFAHCKGVTTTEHQQPRQQRRAAERAGRPALVSYKTVDIAPVTRLLRDQGQIEKTGIKRALHITRGHFAHYTDDAPLFGKYTGTFYRPMHVRGSLEEGLTLKDYRVLGPHEDGRRETEDGRTG